MTRRMVMAVASPHVDILGHCTGRKISADGVMPTDERELKRQPSSFDPDLVFAACAQFDTAVEINCRPERQDPPDDLLDQALEWDCLISIDTDAHAPGQLEWQPYGCDKAAAHDIDPERIVNTWDASKLLDWVSEPAAS
jgi:putative hydrolase